jgi:hypothetical protein
MSSPANIYMTVVDDDDGLYRSLGRLLREPGIQSAMKRNRTNPAISGPMPGAGRTI